MVCQALLRYGLCCFFLSLRVLRLGAALHLLLRMLLHLLMGRLRLWSVHHVLLMTVLWLRVLGL